MYTALLYSNAFLLFLHIWHYKDTEGKISNKCSSVRVCELIEEVEERIERENERMMVNDLEWVFLDPDLAVYTSWLFL